MRIAPRILSSALILLALATTAHAQRGPDVVAEWLDGQRAVLATVQSARALVVSDMTLSSGPTVRRIESGQRTVFDAGGSRTRSTEWLRVDGETLPVDQERQVERRLQAMITPEFSGLTSGHILPHGLIRAADIGRRVRDDVREGLAYRLVEGRLVLPAPPPDRNAGPPPGGRRPPRGGIRGNRPPGGGPPPFPEQARQELRMWFRADTGALALLEQRLVMPGGRGLTIRTTFDRVEGLDVPRTRHIMGDVPSPRRLRTVTVQVDQTISVSEYEFRFTDR